MKSKEQSSTGNENPCRERDEYASRAWGVLIFGIIGATITTYAISQLRRSGHWFYAQLSKSQSNQSSREGNNRSGWESFREETWRRYNRRMQEQYEEEQKRVERIRRMQKIFYREREKYKRSYDRYQEYGPGANQHGDYYYWYDATYRNQRTDSYSGNYDPYGGNYDPYGGNYSMARHYTALGLDSSRAKPYSDEEIKIAFREKAMKYHPDQNPENKEAAEAKFKEVMTSYEAIKKERKIGG